MRVTINDVAKKAKVSRATVSAVINNRQVVRLETREKVLQAIKELNYVPSELARGLSRMEHKVIGLVVRDIANPFHSDITEVVSEIAQRNGYNLVFFNSGLNFDQEAKTIQMLIKMRVSGAIILPQVSNDDTSHLQMLITHNIPFVLINEPIEGLDAEYVYCNVENALYEAIEHLVQLGHKNIAFQRGPSTAQSTDLREKVYKQALNDYGYFLNADYLFYGGADVETSYNSTLKFLRSFPEISAIVAHNDLAAIGVLRAAEELGVLIPDNLALIGVDNIAFSQDLRVPLTTVNIPTRELGKVAIERLLMQINDSNFVRRSTMLDGRLVVRESSGGRL